MDFSALLTLAGRLELEKGPIEDPGKQAGKSAGTAS